ncbi:transmembrane 220 family protein [Coraliomargarita sinensis]|nr:transmembrane 220 family protein [Coraliomargarita sinensis]
MKITCYLFTALFALFSVLQINDAAQYGNHDSWFWLLLYACTAITTFLHARRPLPFAALTAGIGFAVGACLFRLQDAVGNFDFAGLFRATAVPANMNAATQQPNEAAGLLLVAIWLTVLAWHVRPRQSRQTQS